MTSCSSLRPVVSTPDRGGVARPLVVASFVGLVVALCTLLARTLGADPMAGFEIASAISLAAWAGLVARSLWRGRRLAAGISPRTVTTRIQGIECRVVIGTERRAFVLGALHPAIYLGEDLLNGLDVDELRAVLLHEDFHRRTYGPLRAASLEAWISLVRPLARVRDALADRLVDLERAADRHALREGASPAAIASALVRFDAAEAGPWLAFSNAADRRVGGLLAFTAGRGQAPDRLPYEWLPPVVALVTLALCQVVGALTAA